MNHIVLTAARGHSRDLCPLVVLHSKHESNGVNTEVHHTSAAAILDALCEGAVRAAVALACSDVEHSAELAALDKSDRLSEGGSEEPILCIVDMLAEALCGLYHILCVLNGGRKRLLTNDVAAAVHSLDSYVVVQEVGHTDVDKVALALCDRLVVIIVSRVAREAVAIGESLYCRGVLIADADDVNLVEYSAVSVGMKVGRECRTYNQYL